MRQSTCDKEDYGKGNGWMQETWKAQEKVAQLHTGRPVQEDHRQISCKGQAEMATLLDMGKALARKIRRKLGNRY